MSRDSDMDRAGSIRLIQPADNPAVARIVRQVMTEFGAVGCGFSIEDPEVDAMFESYPPPRSAFFVVERESEILGCGGMGPLAGAAETICELRKMYFLPPLRGAGWGRRLLATILASAREAGYRQCYLESLDSMKDAARLYRKSGFRLIDGPLGATGHSGCNRFMAMTL